MSSKASGRVWDLDLPHNKRLVLLAMADHADHDGRNIYPSTDLIAWKTGYSFRQVQRIIDELIADGILIVVKKAKQQHPATYALNFSAGTTKPPFDRATRRQSRQNGIPQSSQDVISEGGQNDTPEKSRDDISAHPGMTFEPSRDDIAMSPKPWNLREPPPPATKTIETAVGGGGGFDPNVVRLFTSYDIKQAEPLARLYRDAFPDVTLDQLRDLCQRLYEPDAGKHAGGRLYRLLKCGPPLVSPPAAPAAPERPPAPILRPGVPVAQLRAWRDRYEKEHSA